jgi:hypothetical protein
MDKQQSCGHSVRYLCTRCHKCYICAHKSFFRKDKWFWECLTDGAIREAIPENPDTQDELARAMGLAFPTKVYEA